MSCNMLRLKTSCNQGYLSCNIGRTQSKVGVYQYYTFSYVGHVENTYFLIIISKFTVQINLQNHNCIVQHKIFL